MGGQRFEPDDTKAYVECRISHSFPSVLFYGSALHPQVIQNSYQTMLHQKVDLMHLVKVYDKDKISRDRIVGSVVAVEFPVRGSAWPIPKSVDDAPCIRAVMAIYKQAEGVDRVLGQHQSGRQRWTVSQEIMHERQTGVFLVKGKSGGFSSTHPEFAALGYEVINWDAAPDSLRAVLPNRAGGKVKPWKDGTTTRDVVFLMGGLNGSVTYEGIGLVQEGAEPEAEISRVLASASDEGEEMDTELREIIDAARQMLDAAKKALDGASDV
jgi:hypothetical protein